MRVPSEAAGRSGEQGAAAAEWFTRCIEELLDALDITISDPKREIDKPFLFAIEGLHRIERRGTVVTGKVERGHVRAGDPVEILGSLAALLVIWLIAWWLYRQKVFFRI